MPHIALCICDRAHGMGFICTYIISSKGRLNIANAKSALNLKKMPTYVRFLCARSHIYFVGQPIQSLLYVTHYAKTNHMQKIFFNGFRNIFAASIVVANLKRISCSLTELRLLFMPLFE